MYSIAHPDIDREPVRIPEHALPSYAARGWHLVEAPREAFPKPPAQRAAVELPPRNAPSAVWKTYAVVAGMPYEDAMAATRDELADKYRPASAPGTEPKRPQKNDSTESWRTYAVANGMTPDEAASMGRDEIVAHFTTEEP